LDRLRRWSKSFYAYAEALSKAHGEDLPLSLRRLKMPGMSNLFDVKKNATTQLVCYRAKALNIRTYQTPSAKADGNLWCDFTVSFS